MQEITWHGLLAVGCSLTLMVPKTYKHIIIIGEWYILWNFNLVTLVGH